MPENSSELKRELGTLQAMMLGLGSIIGTGVFVSLGIGVDVAGNLVLPAIVCAAILAMCNGISSAQLAANHPVSGGTYEYGYRWLHPRLGFTAGWMFMFAKSASAATAALGLVGYSQQLSGVGSQYTLLIALITVLLLTAVTLSGIKRSSTVNSIIVSVTIVTLLAFIVAGMKHSQTTEFAPFQDLVGNWSKHPTQFFEAIALLFVAYTGYGRIATLGEEVVNPRRTIPKAILTTLLASMFLYASVTFVALKCVGAEQFGTYATYSIAPLQLIATDFGSPSIVWAISIGAISAMLGVLLNLILGLSRVLLAMGRRKDVPGLMGNVHQVSGVPREATITVALIISLLILIGDVRLTWSFSAFTVLIYYALTNLCAIRLSSEERLYPAWISYLGLSGCLFLACWINRPVLISGLILLGCAQLWFTASRRLSVAT